MSSFLRKNVLCVFSFCAVKKKKELVVYCNDQIFSVVVFFIFLLILKKVFSSNCLERSQSQCISVDPVSVMYVCLTTLRNLSLDGI